MYYYCQKTFLRKVEGMRKVIGKYMENNWASVE
jgi:hypothetical protein